METSASPSFAPTALSDDTDQLVTSGTQCECDNYSLSQCSSNSNNSNNDDNNGSDKLTIRLLTTESFNYQFVNYLNYYAEKYTEEVDPDLNFVVDSVPGGQQMLEDRILELAEGNDPTYAGYLHPSQITGSLVNLDALWDLTSFVRTDELILWPDVLNFYRERLAVYDNDVRTIPLDGDLLTMYYRKDLFEAFNRTVPRTWDEYSEAAKFFHNRTYFPDGVTPIAPLDENNQTQKVQGSCVGRMQCANSYWARLILFSMTQNKGTSSGALFDPENNMNPLLGEAMVEALRHMANQARFDDPGQFNGCLGYNREVFTAGRCALTYNWGDQVQRNSQSSFQRSYVSDKTGVGRTPGSTRILNRDTLTLENCNAENCPYGTLYEDIGMVNYAPYAAFAGWAASVNNHANSDVQLAAAKFFSYASNAVQSTSDVIPTDDSETKIENLAFSNPYRLSHLDIEEWINQGFEENFAEEYTDALRVVDDANTVIELRIPEAQEITSTFEDKIYPYLVGIVNGSIGLGAAERYALTEDITKELNSIIYSYSGEPSLLEIYQRSLGVFTPNDGDRNLIGESLRYTAFGLCGTVLLCALACAIWTIKEWRSHHNTKYGTGQNNTSVNSLAEWRSRGRVVRASQPYLLLAVCFGIIVMCCTIIPMSVDDSWADLSWCDLSCQLVPWLYFTGFTLFFTPLFSKNYRNYMILDNPEIYTRLKVPKEDFGMIFLSLYGLNAGLLLTWSIISPLHWERKLVNPTPTTEEESLNLLMEETYGSCTGDNVSMAFAIALFLLNFSALLLSLYISYRCSKIKLEYEENKWISLSMIGFIQVWAVSAPLFVLFEDSSLTQALFLLETGVIFTTCGSALVLIFVPKVWYTNQVRRAAQKEFSSTAAMGGGTTNIASGIATPGSSFYSQTSIVIPSIPGASSTKNILDHATSASVPGNKRRRSSFGIKVLSHPTKEEPQLKQWRARLEITKISLEDTKEQIAHVREQLMALLPGTGTTRVSMSMSAPSQPSNSSGNYRRNSNSRAGHNENRVSFVDNPPTHMHSINGNEETKDSVYDTDVSYSLSG